MAKRNKKDTEEPAKRGAPSQFDAIREEWLREKVQEYLDVNEKKAKSKWLNQAVEEWFEAFPYHRDDEPEEFRVITYLKEKTKSKSHPLSTPSQQTSSSPTSETSCKYPTSSPGNAQPDESPNDGTSTKGKPVSEADKFENQLRELSDEALEDLKRRRVEKRKEYSQDASKRKAIRAWSPDADVHC
ncbi:hypothetical protein K435DRAFT_799960 [Dendrothele bispora CBS 962.96]|uniref:Uncharacterized protein n=1 Tax=Dendrothele bispora (strain CBS 962.96) TaxID=1314807 RepID=A0A4S8LU93_DENBC|nr:hypothetical protein K435DRAFT_799960 [Dendrothele bispora CBS 962.96]